MSKIRIKNFGPIKEGYQENDGWIDIKKVTVFIGNQGSGKSTVAKLISMFTWLEKALNRKDFREKVITTQNLVDRWCTQALINNFFTKETEIEYLGSASRFLYSQNELLHEFTTGDKDYTVPKIIYVPSERNFLTTIGAAYDVTGLPFLITGFAEELRRAQNSLGEDIAKLPFETFSYQFDEFRNISYVIGNSYRINLLEAASGLQSSIPLFIVSSNLANAISKGNDDEVNISVNQRIRRNDEITNIYLDKELSDDDKSDKINKVKSRFHNRCLISIVEEPEQNLFPLSQKQILNSLLEFNNMNEGNRLIMTTHSPYIINYLSIAIQGGYLKSKIQESKKAEELIERLNKIVPETSTVQASEVVIYQLDENTGTIRKLEDYEGIPSDKNYLNQSLREGNVMFDALLEIEEEL